MSMSFLLLPLIGTTLLRVGGRGAVVLIDGNNLRGSARFAVSPSALVAITAAWASETETCTLLALDHIHIRVLSHRKRAMRYSRIKRLLSEGR